MLCPGEQVFHLVLFPLRNELDRTVWPIAYPARQSEPARFALGGGPEKHVLYASAHN